MASISQPVRLLFRISHGPALPRRLSLRPATAVTAASVSLSRRRFSATPARLADEEEENSDEPFDDSKVPGEDEEPSGPIPWDALLKEPLDRPRKKSLFHKRRGDFSSVRRQLREPAARAAEKAAMAAIDPKGPLFTQEEMNEMRENKEFMTEMLTVPRVDKSNWWEEDEPDEDMITGEPLPEEPFDEDDILAMAHSKLEEVREHREYARIAAWEMPLLSKLAKPYSRPLQGHVLRFRYTTYLGEVHPAERKVVVQFSPADMPLTDEQKLKLKKLVGARYNPEKDMVKMSCEAFDHPAQNKRYLGDLVNKLIAEAENDADTFADLPLDLRHHTFITKPKFPREWRMGPERVQQLEQVRQLAAARDDENRATGKLVDGKEVLQAHFARLEAQKTEREAVMVEAGVRGDKGR